MRIYRPGLLSYLFIFTILISAVSSATNFYERHGNNFIYLESQHDTISPVQYDTLTYAPVIWDIRAAFIELHKYYGSYGWESSEDCDSSYKAIDLLMEEAWDHGVNFANARGEIFRMSPAALDSGPQSLHHFVNVARIVRENHLHLTAGGFKTDTSDAREEHNDAVISYLSQYKDSSYVWPGNPGDFIGISGFDAPEGRYEGPGWNQCQYDSVWYYLVKDYAEESRDLISDDILPFGTFIDRWRTQEGDSIFYYRQTIPLFCGELESPVLDKYPCKYDDPLRRTFPDQIEFDEIIGSTDLLPSGSVDYEAWADQDDIFAVDGDGWFRVYQFENVTSHTDTIEISRVESILLPSSLRDDPVWAASDFRAVDVGDRDSDSHRLNGAIVFFDEDDPDENMVIFHDGTDIVFLEDELEMPANALSMTAVCVGEYNYPVHHPTASSRRGSLISHGELRILVCYKSGEGHDTVDRARVFAWNYGTEEFDDVTGDSLGLELDFEPVKAVWGVFWPTYNWWNSYNSEDQSGFIVLGSSANYQSIYEYIRGSSTVEWAVSDEFTNLFAWDETSFIARKTFGFPCYTAGIDYICHLKDCVTEEEAVLEFASDPGGSPNSALSVYTSSPFDLPEPYTFSNINDAASCRPLTFNDDALVIVLKYINPLLKSISREEMISASLWTVMSYGRYLLMNHRSLPRPGFTM